MVQVHHRPKQNKGAQSITLVKQLRLYCNSNHFNAPDQAS
uniref:Uncharacterized protein n=1 Tax=Arundo donax TaxID=35708 RepID=A0A0A9H222_ARUDO